MNGLSQVDGGAALAEDGPCPLGGGVVVEPRLHRSQRLGPVLVGPVLEVPGPPLRQVGVAHICQYSVLEALVVGEELEAVQDGVLLVGVHPLVGLVEGLDGELQNGLHPRPPLVPQAPAHPNHRVGGPVPVGEDAGVQQVDARGAPLVGKVDEANGVGNLRGNVPEQSLNQVCVGIDDDDGVGVPARRLLIHLVSHDVVHEGGLAHAGAGGVEVVASQQVVGEADLPGIARSGLSHQRAAPDAPGGRSKRPRSRPLHQGRLVTRSRRVPQGRRLTHPYDAAPAEQSGAFGMKRLRVGDDGLDLAKPEPRPRRIFVVAVGRPPPAPAAPLRAWVPRPATGRLRPAPRRRKRCGRPSP